MKILLELYVFGAFAYAGLCAFEISTNPARERIVDHYRRMWNERPFWGQQAICVLVVLLAAVWPLLLALRFVPAVQDVARRNFRRDVLDREGFLTPQMPAPRCLTHDRPLERMIFECTRCRLKFELPHCHECEACHEDVCWLEDGARRDPFVCMVCVPPRAFPRAPFCRTHRAPMVWRTEPCPECRNDYDLMYCQTCGPERAPYKRCGECAAKDLEARHAS